LLAAGAVSLLRPDSQQASSAGLRSDLVRDGGGGLGDRL
jgi:hypothetical protein